MNRITESVFKLYPERPAVALLMSGAGSNARVLLDDEVIRDLYNISTIATDNPASGAAALGAEYGVDVLVAPARRFADREAREEYFTKLRAELGRRKIQAAFYAGFMKIVTSDFCEALPGVNVHPADLTIAGDDGLPKYRGMHALQDMRRDLGYVRSTVHVVDAVVDSGSAIAVSKAVFPEPDMTDTAVHEALKIQEHRVFPEVLRRLGEGSISLNDIPLSLYDSEEH